MNKLCSLRGNNILFSLFLPIIAFNLLFPTLKSNAQNYYPKSYWTFDYPGNAMHDSMNFYNLDPNYYQSIYTINTAASSGVGKYMTLAAASTYIKSGQLVTDSAFTIEFLFRPGYLFNTSKMFYRGDGTFNIKMGYPYIQFATTIKNASGSFVSDYFKVDLNQIGRKSYGYYQDGNFHHFVFKYNANTGVKEIWVDGQLPAGFSFTTTTGTVDNSASANKDLYMDTGNAYELVYGDFDEFATYPYGLPANMIYKHYTEFMNHSHYSFSYTSTPPPTPSSVTGAVDLTEFPPGHPTVSVSAIDQLKTFPLPRYKTGHTLLPNFTWVDPVYLGSRFQPGVTDNVAVANSVTMQTEMAKNYNYMLQVTWSNDAWNDSWINLANQNPSLKLSLITFRAQIANNKITSQALANDHYLQNSNGQFIDVNGNVTTNKLWRPTAPVADYTYDGQTAKSAISNVLVGRLTRSIDFVNDNGEVFPLISNTAMSLDPTVTSAKNSSGLDWENYLASKYKENQTQAYRDQFMGLSVFNANSKFTEYRIDGHRDYQFRWEQTRYINSPINGQYYPTSDFYVRWASNWRNWTGPWHGWQWIADSRYNELAQGDKLYSPFVGAGWDANPENDVRPAQWLGLLKCLSMTGAEFFYTSYFNEAASYMPPSPPPYDPKGYVWQVVMPSYAQGIASRYEDYYRNGYLMSGDVPNDYVTPTFNAYNFKTGDLRKLVVVRKNNTLNKYAITGTIQPNSNMNGNAENESIATITLDGQTLKFKVRRQGSTYIYDNTIPSAPVFYQLDLWHDSKHPYYWTKDFNIEGELYDNINFNVYIKTRVPAGAAAGDFTQATSCVGFNAVTDVQYNFQPRGLTAQTYYFWVRARSKDGSSTGFTALLDGSVSNQFDCIRDTNWVWYRYNVSGTAVTYASLGLSSHLLKITAANTKLEIDQIALTTTSGAVYGTATSPCSASATITPGGATTFCQGGSVVLSANSGTAYLWNTGASTQSVTVSTSGTFTVTVTSTSGTAISSPVTVTVNALPTATITAGGATTFCQGGNVTLTSSAGTSYLWSPGNQTTSAITATSSGNYTVKVTNSSGCSATSAAKVVTVNPLPAATISASGSLTILQGTTVTLTSSSGSSYLWSPGNQTTQAIMVGTAGSYTVRVTNSYGCSSTSSPAVVTVTTSGATITAGGPTTFCQGGSVSLTANSGTNYLWSTGATTQSITASASGNYVVTVTNGTQSVSGPLSVTVNPLPTATITAGGATSFCTGGSVVLTSSVGNSYLWSPNNSTTQAITVTTTGSYSVRVTNSYGCSATSSTTNVTVTNCGSCPIPTGLYTTSVTANSATLNWAALAGVDSLQVKLVEVVSGYTYITGVFRGTFTNLTVGSVSNTHYRWRIRSKCGSTFTAWSSAAYYTTPILRSGEPNVNQGQLIALHLASDQELESDQENLMLTVFPNPARGSATISYNSDYQGEVILKILDFTGKLQLSETLNANGGRNQYPIDINHFAKGIYMVVINENGIVNSKRIVVN